MKFEIAQIRGAGIKRSGALLFLFVSLSVSGCSLPLTQLFIRPTVALTPTPVVIFTSTRTPSTTPTLPTPTFTLTPTLIGEKTKTPTSTDTPSVTPGTPPTPITPDTPTPTTYMDGLVSVRLSTDRFFTRGCNPTSVTFNVQVADAGRVNYVVLFVRFKSGSTGANSVWTNLTMESLGGGAYTFELKPEEILGLDFFEDPQIQYQLVTTDSRSKVLGRTGIFKNNLTLMTTTFCTATPTLTAGQPITSTP